MELSNLTKTTIPQKKRLGQGHGSGKVKTGGRGTKGQKARGKIPQRIKLGGVQFVKRLPLFRGKSKNKKVGNSPLIINLKDLEDVKANTSIDLNFLISQKYVKKSEAETYGVKLLGDGKIATPLTIKIKISKSARRKVEKAGGKVEDQVA